MLNKPLFKKKRKILFSCKYLPTFRPLLGNFGKYLQLNRINKCVRLYVKNCLDYSVPLEKKVCDVLNFSRGLDSTWGPVLTVEDSVTNRALKKDQTLDFIKPERHNSTTF